MTDSTGLVVVCSALITPLSTYFRVTLSMHCTCKRYPLHLAFEQLFQDMTRLKASSAWPVSANTFGEVKLAMPAKHLHIIH